MNTESNTTLPTFTVPERAVNYARVSYDDRGNEGRNLQGQLDMDQEHCQQKGYRIVAELEEDDRGASGAEIDLPKLNQIREMARNREFDVLVVRELDRLSRNLAKQLIVEEELNRAGVRVEYVLAEYDDTPEGRLQKHIRATVAEYEREKIKERMVRGKRNKVKAGNVIVSGRPPYGYKLVKAEHKVTLEIDEDKDAIVKQIFFWYVFNGLSMWKIAERLNEMGVAPPTTRSRLGWGDTAVFRILSNETYAGIWYYGKKNKRTEQSHPRENWIAVEVQAIIDRETWEDAQFRLKMNKLESRRNLKNEYLLSKRVTCGDCGCKLVGATGGKKWQPYSYYLCHVSRGHKDMIPRGCKLPSFRSDYTDQVVWEWIYSILSDPENLAKAFEEYRAKQERRNAPVRERLQIVDKLLADHRTQLARLLDLYLAGNFDLEILTDRKNRLEMTINSLERERNSLKNQLETRILTDDQIQTIKDFTQETRAGLAAVNNFPTRRMIIELLDVRVTLKMEEGQKVILAQCDLGSKRLCVVSPTTN